VSATSPGQALAVLFGHGDDDHPLWLLAVRANVLLLVGALGLVLASRLTRLRWRHIADRWAELLALGACSLVALVVRFAAASNLLDQGGIPYSRLLVGYRGYFATAQAYALFYLLGRRDLEHAILLNRLVGAATIPLTFALCRTLRPRSMAFPIMAAGLLALSPLHILLSASDALSVFSGFLCALSYLLVATEGAACLLAGALGLALLTQVRYENALLVVPPVLLLVMRRRGIDAAVCVVAGLAYAWPSLAAGLSFQEHVRLADGWRLVTSNEVLFNPFLAVPFLFGGTLLVALARRPLLLLFALAPWTVAAALTIATAESAHHAARGFSNWLLLLVVPAGYGFSLLAERGRYGRVAAGVLLAYFAAKPIRYAGTLRTQYLEVAEHEAFRTMLAAQPPDTVAIVVPDDDLLRRRSGATIETMNKYLSIRAALPRPGAPLVGTTELLAGQADECTGGHCLFFAGLPCLVESINTPAPTQCAKLASEHDLVPLAERTITAAPFERCAVYVEALRRDLCEPTERAVTLALYRIQ
jgi:hypothetical protein